MHAPFILFGANKSFMFGVHVCVCLCSVVARTNCSLIAYIIEISHKMSSVLRVNRCLHVAPWFSVAKEKVSWMGPVGGSAEEQQQQQQQMGERVRGREK